MVQSILSNLAILLLGHLLMSTLMTYQNRLSKNLVYICIIFLFSTVVISMFYLPIEFGGYRLDLRLIPLILLAMFRGWRVTLPVLIVVSTWRFSMGGSGAIPGIVFGMVLPTLFTLVYYKYNKTVRNVFEKIVLVTVCWFISDFPILFIVPDGIYVFKEIFMIRYSSFLLATFTYYAFIQLEYKRHALQEQLTFLASHDSLTKLLNKNKFIQFVEERLSRNPDVNKYIVMIDIDHFKELNDTFGHIAGDNILIQLASLFKNFENENILIARYGGEEFIIYQESINTEQAIQTMKEIQRSIRDTSFQIDSVYSISISVSIGLAEWKADSTLLDAIKQADGNLYVAKQRGRDKLVISND